ncbi:hypothetical protein SDC9_162575 [bioreactor metagenome]|uniref:Uncharacterized protein n=1 Tax=bioreactor metagenome TaxID=1076179 RepID=A0A645FLG7_9ZZZZ
MTYDPAHFLVETREITRDVFECNDRNVECVAYTNVAACLVRCIDIKASCHELGLVGNYADRPSANPGKTCNYVTGIHFLNFAEISVVNDLFDDIADVISLVGVCRDHLTKSRIHSRRIITCFYEWRFFHVVAGQIAEHFSCLSVALGFIFREEMRTT